MADTIQGIEQLAALSVGRGCRYAILSIFILAIGASSSLPGACEAGASLFLLVAAMLALKAHRARRRPIQSTELWSLLNERPSADVGQRLLGPILRDCYLEFAMHMARLSAVLMSAAIVLSFAH
jgi:hypothetical protein